MTRVGMMKAGIGYTVQYKFDDIRTVKLNQNSLPGAAREYVEATGQSLGEEEGGSLIFTMEGNELTIHSTMIAGGMNDLIDQEQINQGEGDGNEALADTPDGCQRHAGNEDRVVCQDRR